MLLNFKLQNFLSFRKEVEFTTLASRELQHKERVFRQPGLALSVLPVAAFYGGNGAGKSNFYSALKFAKRFILRGRARPEDAIDVEPFRLDDEYINKPTSFSFDIMVAKAVYRYSFAVTHARVLLESLAEVKGERETPVFTRNGEGEKPVWNVDYFKRLDLANDELQFIEFKTRDTLPNQLFLSEVRGRKVPIVEAVGDWFQSKLVLLDPHSAFKPVAIGLRQVESFREYSVRALERAGTGISGLENETVSLENLPLPGGLKRIIERQLETSKEGEMLQVVDPEERQRFFVFREAGKTQVLQLVTYHDDRAGRKVRFEMPDESEGTRRLIDLLPAFFELSSPDTEKVFFIDEIDRSLHTHLTRGLLESFLETRTIKSKGQLFFTTHDGMLLDQSLLRRDEIWFFDKNQHGESELSALSDFKGVRNDKDIRKSYLLGRFGGVPEMRPMPRRTTDNTEVSR